MFILCMRQQLEAITAGFEGLKRLRQEVLETSRAVEQRVAILRKAHEDLVAASPQSACALGLDSLHFQVRLVSMELKSLREMIHAVENHLYYECLYLHKSVQSYASAEITDTAARDRILCQREYPPYKYLDSEAQYDFDITVGLHAQLVSSIQAMGAYCDEQESIIEREKGKSAQGLNIHSLVHSNKYVLALLSAKTKLFLRSLGAFNGHHGKYMRRIKEKGQLVLTAITKDVRLAGSKDETDPAQESGEATVTPDDQDVALDTDSVSDTESSSESGTDPDRTDPAHTGDGDQIRYAIYTHADGEQERVEIRKEHSSADGGGFTIFVPSLGRERSTLADRLTMEGHASPEQEAAPAHASVPDPQKSTDTSAGTPSDGSSRLTEAQRERKRKKQKRMRERKKEKRATSPEGDPDNEVELKTTSE